MQLELFEHDDSDGAGYEPATYSHLSKVHRAERFDMSNAAVRIAAWRHLHMTEPRNVENGNNFLFWYAARLIAGEY